MKPTNVPLLRAVRARGAALVIVLSFLVLTSVLVLGFFLSVSRELTASKRYADSVTAQSLADSALSLATGAIRDATSGGTSIAWASQPGMIRTYGTANGTPSAAPLQYYKLFSSDRMVVPGAAFNPNDDLDAAWDTKPAVWTDLNAPVLVPLPGGNTSRPVFPILDPRAKTSQASTSIEGFDYTAGVAGVVTDTSAPNSQRLPMPVRWIYVLRDGTLTTPTGTGANGSATWTGSSNIPSSANPIVGRFAFWGDDETSKLNINTAAEGVFWDTPRANNTTERSFGARQPARREWQRYPGHPATTSLSPVLFPDTTLTEAQREQIYNEVTPRVVGGGSQGGSVTVTALKSSGATALNPDADRIYANVDELLMMPDRDENPIVSEDLLERARFFLTASSRAPEVNLFNLPRISMWPIHASLAEDSNPGQNPYTTEFDRLIAFCSTIGPDRNPFYFQRKSADSPTEDYSGPETYARRNRELYAYLQRLTNSPVPGFSDTASFSSKYPTDRDQILTQVVDYIRATNAWDDLLGTMTNPNSPGVYTSQPNEGTFPQFTNPLRTPPNVPGQTDLANPISWPGHNQVAPLRIGNTQGFGRFFTITEAALAFLCVADPSDTTTPAMVDNWPLPASLSGTTSSTTTFGQRSVDPDFNPFLGSLPAPVAGQRRIQAALLFQGFCPAFGPGLMQPAMWIRISGLSSLRVNGNALFAQDTVYIYPHTYDSSPSFVDAYNGIYKYGLGIGGLQGPRFFMIHTSGSGAVNLSGRTVVVEGIAARIPSGIARESVLAGVKFDVPTAGGTMSFSGGSLTVDIATSNQRQAPGTTPSAFPADAEVVQTLTLPFESAPFPIPRLVCRGSAGGSSGVTGGPRTQATDWWDWSSRFRYDPVGVMNLGNRGQFSFVTRDNMNALIKTNDVARSVVASFGPPGTVQDGDYRLVAGAQSPPASGFRPHFLYRDTSENRALSIRDATADVDLGARIIENAADRYPSGIRISSYTAEDRTPALGLATSPASQARRDFDNGHGATRDGAYINKPDDGDLVTRELVNEAEGTNTPYFNTDGETFNLSPDATFFSPNRKVPSAGMFGSLPTGLKAGVPFQTLLFRPDPSHPGAQAPRDHLLMDLFHMPVVEPYAISEPLSTAGKINMNYQILPFSYIKRRTGLHGLLKNERIMAIGPAAAGTGGSGTEVNKYKGGGGAEYRFSLNLDPTNGTLRAFEDRFAANDIFRSPTEICDIPLVPVGQNQANMTTFWNNRLLTGDNVRERPYANVVGRLTTKSNTFTIHVRAQALRKVPGTPADQWVEGRDQIVGEFRGSYLVERYVDPADPRLPDFATLSLNDPRAAIDQYYRLRILSSRRFAP